MQWYQSLAVQSECRVSALSEALLSVVRSGPGALVEGLETFLGWVYGSMLETRAVKGCQGREAMWPQCFNITCQP